MKLEMCVNYYNLTPSLLLLVQLDCGMRAYGERERGEGDGRAAITKERQPEII